MLMAPASAGRDEPSFVALMRPPARRARECQWRSRRDRSCRVHCQWRPGVTQLARRIPSRAFARSGRDAGVERSDEAVADTDVGVAQQGSWLGVQHIPRCATAGRSNFSVGTHGRVGQPRQRRRPRARALQPSKEFSAAECSTWAGLLCLVFLLGSRPMPARRAAGPAMAVNEKSADCKPLCQITGIELSRRTVWAARLAEDQRAPSIRPTSFAALLRATTAFE
jgi:hypothetical protein